MVANSAIQRSSIPEAATVRQAHSLKCATRPRIRQGRRRTVPGLLETQGVTAASLPTAHKVRCLPNILTST
jgi:hypothetical protein